MEITQRDIERNRAAAQRDALGKELSDAGREATKGQVSGVGFLVWDLSFSDLF